MVPPSASTTFTVDGNFDVVSINGRTWIHLDGTFGGGTVAVNIRDDSGNWKPFRVSGTALTYTAAADDFIDFPGEVAIRLALSGSTGASIYAQLRSEPRR